MCFWGLYGSTSVGFWEFLVVFVAAFWSFRRDFQKYLNVFKEVHELFFCVFGGRGEFNGLRLILGGFQGWMGEGVVNFVSFFPVNQK